MIKSCELKGMRGNLCLLEHKVTKLLETCYLQ